MFCFLSWVHAYQDCAGSDIAPGLLTVPDLLCHLDGLGFTFRQKQILILVHIWRLSSRQCLRYNLYLMLQRSNVGLLGLSDMGLLPSFCLDNSNAIYPQPIVWRHSMRSYHLET